MGKAPPPTLTRAQLLTPAALVQHPAPDADCGWGSDLSAQAASGNGRMLLGMATAAPAGCKASDSPRLTCLCGTLQRGAGKASSPLPCSLPRAVPEFLLWLLH